MRTTALITLLLACACAGPRYAERTRPVPPAPPARVAAPVKSAVPVNEEATRAWLDQEIELAPRPQPPQPIVQVVERPVYVPQPYDPSWRQYDYGGYYYPSYPYDYRSSFPVHTALGAGIGAIIGHQSGHRSEGAWIGSGIGFLLDLGSCW